MKQKIRSFLRRLRVDQGAQVLPIMAVMMLGFFGMTACVIDVGRIYYAYNELQASTQAAALAGASVIANPNVYVPGYTSSTITPNAVANYYGSAPGGLNAQPILSSAGISVSTTINLSCNNFVKSLGILCITYSNECGTSACPTGTQGVNAIQVVQVAEVKTIFAALFGTPYVTLTSSAAAARAGAPAIPANMVIIADTTDSMSSQDTNCIDVQGTTGKNGSGGTKTTYYTRLQCALNGIQTLLTEMAPCYSNEGSCNASSTTGAATPSVDRVALFTFPNLYATAANVEEDYDCGTTNPTIQPYSFPSDAPTSTSTYSSTLVPATGLNATYAITYGLGDADGNGFVSDYKTADLNTTLNSTSDIVKAIGGVSGCASVGNPGGAGTFYAGAIYAATAALAAEQAANPNSTNVIILVSDGDASSSATQKDSYECAKGTTGCSCQTGSCTTGTVSTTQMGSASASATTYPGGTDECGQAITAANYAITSGIVNRIYAVAYGAESTGCGTDKAGTYSFQGTSANFTPKPCSTMEDIASSPNYFYSDYNQSGGGTDTSCIGQNTSDTALADIFSDIASDFSTARLIPNSQF